MFLLFLLFWIIFNANFTLEILLFGIVISAALYAFVWKFMGYGPKQDLFLLKKLPLVLLYLLRLIWEVIKAALGVIRVILSRKKPDPVIVTFRTDLKTTTARVLLANSITLTPGTISVQLEEDRYTVHCLDRSMSKGMDESCFVKLLRKLEGGAR